MQMYLIDTNVISELRKKGKMNTGVESFFNQAHKNRTDLYISVVTVGELFRGLRNIRHRGDVKQAQLLALWLNGLVEEYQRNILAFDEESAQIWARLRVPNHENAPDKQIVATAFVYGLTLVTRNTKDFAGTGVKLINPFN